MKRTPLLASLVAIAALGTSLLSCGGKAIIGVWGELDATVGAGGAGTDAGADAYAGSGGAAGTGGSGTPDCSPGCAQLEECGTIVATGARVCVSKSISVAGGFSIDATETTYAQYQAALPLTKPSASLMPSYCTSWKADYSPGSGTANHPVANVDWCDAWAYCARIGKRLCGKIGGGPTAWGGFADPAQSQWYNACTSGAPSTHAYPYGNTYQPATCNDYAYWADKDAGAAAATLPAGTVLTNCTSTVSGYTGTFDLSGNVLEWEDSCNGTTGENDNCMLRGGSFANYYGFTGYLACGLDDVTTRNFKANIAGFRCCGT